jgi:hypothetical protein
MKSRRLWVAVLVMGVVVAFAAALAPVSAEGFDSCGVAGTWFPYLGDPTGPGDPTMIYADYNACGRAAVPWHLTMLAAMLAAAAASVGLLRAGR